MKPYAGCFKVFSFASGLVRARGLKRLCSNYENRISVRARKSPWIETIIFLDRWDLWQSGLVRARGLKQTPVAISIPVDVRARKSPWIETVLVIAHFHAGFGQGS